MRGHGGDLDRARATYSGSDWIDLSTGINPVAHPMPDLPPRAVAALSTVEEIAVLETAAANAYGAESETAALSGAQAAIQLVPRLKTPGLAAALAPSYSEHADALLAQGWTMEQVT